MEPRPSSNCGPAHRAGQYVEPTALILFIEVSAEDSRNADLRSLDPAELKDGGATHALAEELQSTKTLLVTSREDYETAIEELRAANEEMQSVGEEYRSTAEELETSKEELQSVNEELQAANQELTHRVEAISRAHNDLRNLISVTDVGTLFSMAICASGVSRRGSPIFSTSRPTMKAGRSRISRTGCSIIPVSNSMPPRSWPISSLSSARCKAMPAAGI